jgi:crotonobetainyl-CoA:carnitine CoA-transferase CaiB-like acyl-CoA transferase
MRRGSNVGSWYHDAPYGAYALADGHIVLSMNDPVKLAEALDSDPLRGLIRIDRYSERERYAAAVATELRDRRIADVASRFEAAGLWFERIQSYDDLREDQQLKHMDAFVDFPVGDRNVTLVSHPLRYDGASPEIRRMPLEPGCDSIAILAECGFDDDTIDRLVAEGVVGQPHSTETAVHGSTP